MVDTNMDSSAAEMSRRTALALAAGAAVGPATLLPIGIQIVGPHRRELACLQLAYAYELATNWTNARVPSLLGHI